METLSLNITTPLLPEIRVMMNQGWSLPRGIRNANPGNIRPSERYVWRGQKGVDPDKYCIFEAPIYGIRAMAIIIVNYIEHHDIDTIEGVINRWSGDTPIIKNAYADYVSRWTGINADLPFPFDTLGAKAIEAMIGFENGSTFDGKRVSQYYDMPYIIKAVGLSHER